MLLFGDAKSNVIIDDWLYDNKTFNNNWVDVKKKFNKWFGKRFDGRVIANGKQMTRIIWYDDQSMVSPWYDQKYWWCPYIGQIRPKTLAVK